MTLSSVLQTSSYKSHNKLPLPGWCQHIVQHYLLSRFKWHPLQGMETTREAKGVDWSKNGTMREVCSVGVLTSLICAFKLGLYISPINNNEVFPAFWLYSFLGNSKQIPHVTWSAVFWLSGIQSLCVSRVKLELFLKRKKELLSEEAWLCSKILGPPL